MFRCGDNPLIGRPRKVTTVDKYQGQQNDYILLSLVRTRAVGHVRDVRRLVVAMSRARLGLYVFARASLFHNCFELAPAFNQVNKNHQQPKPIFYLKFFFQLMAKPLELELVLNEPFPLQRPAGVIPSQNVMRVSDMTHMANFVYQYYMEKVKYMQNYYVSINNFCFDFFDIEKSFLFY